MKRDTSNKRHCMNRIGPLLCSVVFLRCAKNLVESEEQWLIPLGEKKLQNIKDDI